MIFECNKEVLTNVRIIFIVSPIILLQIIACNHMVFIVEISKKCNHKILEINFMKNMRCKKYD